MVFRTGNTIIAVLFAVLLLAPGASAWAWPVDGPVLRPFVAEGNPYSGGQHRGIDIGAPTGSDVHSATSGVVAFAGQLPRQGLCLTVRTEDGYSVTLVHLGSIGVSVGTLVSQGDVVGTIGPSGEPEGTEPYVYLGIRLTADPNGYVDPLTLLPPRHAPEQPPPPQQQAPSQAPAPPAPPQQATPPRSAGHGSPHAARAHGHAAQPTVAKPKPRPVRAPVPTSVRHTLPAPRGVETEHAADRRADGRSAGVRGTHSRAPAVAPARVGDRRHRRITLPVVRHPRPAAAKVPPVARKRSGRARRALLVPLGVLGLALLAGGVLSRRRQPLQAARPFAQPPLRKMSTTEPVPEDRLPEPPTTANSRRRRVALREWPTAPGACRRLRRAVGHHRPVSPTSGRPGPHDQRHGRARNAGHGRGRSRRTVAA
jgi:Peptidase family M23